MEKALESQLWRRIEAFRINSPDASLPFTSRLAREQAWSHAFAARVVAEYRRFVFIAMEAGHPVTPSEPVDQVWHLHLTYTRSYWKEFCAGTIGRELHHEPTAGGDAEGSKFRNWYARTLESYVFAFEDNPPPDIWPCPDARFARAGCRRWVDTSRHWIVPRPQWSFPPQRR